MSAEVVIITPGIAPGSGGLADYTLRVIQQWRDAYPLRLLIPQPAIQPASGSRFHVESVARSASALLAKLPPSGGKVLLQYSAYGFDHYGYPRWLLRALADWKQRSGGLLVAMVHEIWTFWPVLNKNYLLQQLHRRDLRHLLNQTNTAFTSTASQAELLRALAPAAKIQLLPVGSNVIPASGLTRRRELGLAVLFGLEGSRVYALQKLRDELQRAGVSGQLRKLVTVGGGESTKAEQELLESLQLAGGYEQRGPLPESEVSMLLSQASFGISAQDELSVTKSGTFMAYAAHGLNIISPYAHSAGTEPLCWATEAAELARGIPEEQLRARAETLRDWQERTCSWPHIAQEFAQALHLNPTAARS